MRFILPEGTPENLPTEPERIEYDLDARRLCACGRMFTPYRPFQRYCCDAHRIKYSKGKATTYRKKPIVEKQCKECGKVFKSNDAKRHYCSTECYEAFQLKRRTPKEVRKCFNCGKEFESSHWSKRYCSNECRMEARHK